MPPFQPMLNCAQPAECTAKGLCVNAPMSCGLPEHIEKLRPIFEEVISSGPHEKSVKRFPADKTRFAWPGSYCYIDVDLAWQVLCEVMRKSADETRHEQRELTELLLKSARRCAHDLGHAAEAATDPDLRALFQERAQWWRDLFYPENGIKDYHTSLMRKVEQLEAGVKRLGGGPPF